MKLTIALPKLDNATLLQEAWVFTAAAVFGGLLGFLLCASGLAWSLTEQAELESVPDPWTFKQHWLWIVSWATTIKSAIGCVVFAATTLVGPVVVWRMYSSEKKEQG